MDRSGTFPRGVAKAARAGKGVVDRQPTIEEVLGLERERGLGQLVRRLQRDLEALLGRQPPRDGARAAVVLRLAHEAADAHGIAGREGRRVAGPTGFERVPLRRVLLAYYDVDVEGFFQVVPQRLGDGLEVGVELDAARSSRRPGHTPRLVRRAGHGLDERLPHGCGI